MRELIDSTTLQRDDCDSEAHSWTAGVANGTIQLITENMIN
jgi:hypothetical protein